jgi:ABC-type lipoprotein export system ATPase subunit
MSMIHGKSIAKRYVAGDIEVQALKGVSFDIDAGAFASFVGPSGSGKSTLLNLVGCLDQPDGGRLTVLSTDVAALSRQAAAVIRGASLGFVFQDFNLVPVLTVIVNLRDHSFSLTPELAYTGIENVELRARWIVLHGTDRSEFGARPIRSRLEAYARWAF